MKKSLLLAFLGALICACSTTTNLGVSNVSRSQMMLVSSDTINAQAAQAYNEVIAKARQKGVLNTDKALYARIERITQRLIKQAPFFRADCVSWNWQVNVIDSKELNAWCMPGGKIAVYSALVEKLRLSDDEIAAVIGHEMAHALREHSREQASQDLLKNSALMIASMFGVDNSLLNLSNQALTLGVSLPYSRTNENEADEIGLELATRAGFNPQAAVSVWQKMQALSGSGASIELLSTHPSHEHRIENLQKLATKLEAEYGKKETK